MVHADVARDLAVRPDTSPTASDARHLRWLKGKLGDRMTVGLVLHLGGGCPWMITGSRGGTLRFGTVADFDPTIPSIARVYDYLLGGKDNFAVDREVAEKLLAVVPISADVMRENRQFLASATRWAAGQGITQFVDLGCGMPTSPNTQGSARTVITEPRVAYVDNDEVVLAHLRALAAHGNPGVTVVESDVREVAATLEAVSAGIDLAHPVCLLMGALLHFFAADAARDLVASYVAALAPGGYVVLSVGRGDGDAASQGFRAYSSGGNQSYNHSVSDFTSFFGDLTLVPPGIVDARGWHPDPGAEGPFPPRSGYTIARVARVA